MPNKITTLIFDFDGVIANTDLGRYKLLKDILLDYNSDFVNTFNRKDLIGLSTKAFLVNNLKHLSEAEIQEIINKRHELYFSNLSDYCIPYDNLNQTISFLSSKYDLAIVTTNSVENVTKQLKHLGIFELFNWVIGRETCENSNFKKTYKPISNIIKKKVSECIVIEDSDLGVNAAREEGYYCLRFDPDNLFQNGLENVKISNYKELIDLIRKVE